jgi:YVTN family beta-propeller protein
VIDGTTNATSTVRVGAGPRALAVNPVTNKVYVANGSDASVTVVDGATGDTETVRTGTDPVDVAVNPLTNMIYVPTLEGRVAVINGWTNDTAFVAVGDTPVAVAVNPVSNKVYVANSASDDVTIIDGYTNHTRTVAVGQDPVALAVNPMTHRCYVANNGSNDMTVLDEATPTTTTVAAGQGPAYVAVNTVNNTVYVANSADGTVTLIDGTSNGTTTVPADSEPCAVAVNPVTGTAYVTNHSRGTVTMIDEGPAADTRVFAQIDTAFGHTTLLARPAMTGTALNRLEPFHSPMMGVMCRRGTSQRNWLWADTTAGAGTDSLNWSIAWGADSLVSGENFICVMPLEADAATTNNEGLGSLFAGNMVVYPVYRTWGLGIEEPTARPRTMHAPGASLLRGTLFLQEARDHSDPAASLLDITGRKARELRFGANDVSHLAPGVYFVKLSSRGPTRKVVIQD